MDRDRGFAVVEAHALHFRLPRTCYPIHVNEYSLKTRWTSTPKRENSRTKLQNVVTDSTALGASVFCNGEGDSVGHLRLVLCASPFAVYSGSLTMI